MIFECVPTPDDVNRRHQALGGKDLAFYQADLGPLFLNVMSGLEPIKPFRLTKHVTCVVKDKATGQVVRAPTAAEVAAVGEFFNMGGPVEWSNSGLMANFWGE